MPRRIRSLRVITPALGLIAVAILARCTLGTFRPTITLTFEPPTSRALADLDQFAVVVRGGVSNTLRSNDVGGRSLSCLRLNGQVAFPYTLAQLRQGIQLTIPHGEYEAEIVAFDSVVGAPATVPALYASSPALKGYPVAKKTFSTLSSSSVLLTSTYSGATQDLLVQCPVPQGIIHALVRANGEPKYLRRESSTWSISDIEPGRAVTSGRLVVDELGTVHVAYGFDGGSDYGPRYANNSGGSFVSEQVTAAGLPNIYKTSGLALIGGAPHVLTNTSCVSCVGALFVRSAAVWSFVDNFFVTSGGNLFTDFSIHAGPSSSLVGSRIEQSLPSRGLVGTRTSPLAATALRSPITTDGVTTCTSGISQLQSFMDGAGNVHAIYFCEGSGERTVGYATDLSGSWVLSRLTSASPYYASLDGYLDPAGFLHVATENYGNLETLTINTADGETSFLQGIYNNGSYTTGRVAVAATSPSDAFVLVYLADPQGSGLLLFSNKSGAWQYELTINGLVSPEALDLDVR